MNGIEKITERIIQDSNAQVAQIEAETQAQVAEIQARFEKQCMHETEVASAKNKNNAAEHQRNLESAAQMDALKITLAAKQEMLDKAFELALDKLVTLPENEYVDLLAKLAVSYSTSGSEELILNKNDHNNRGEKIIGKANELLSAAGKAAKLSLAKECGDFAGGLLLRDGDVEVNCAFETLIRLSRNSIAGEVAAVLFN